MTGTTARDLIDVELPGHQEKDEDEEDAMKAALDRLFERAPACLARSWAWPAGILTAAGIASDVAVWRRQAVAESLGVTIFRPTRGGFFSRRFAR